MYKNVRGRRNEVKNNIEYRLYYLLLVELVAAIYYTFIILFYSYLIFFILNTRYLDLYSATIYKQRHAGNQIGPYVLW